MTLDEAIKHCEEKAKEIWQANEEMPSDCKLSKGLCECAKEHEQLAKWLEDYKRLLGERRQGKWDEICEPFGWADILSARCSSCGESYPYPEDTGFNDIVEMFKYCPNCGAKMEAGDRWKEEEDEE